MAFCILLNDVGFQTTWIEKRLKPSVGGSGVDGSSRVISSDGETSETIPVLSKIDSSRASSRQET